MDVYHGKAEECGIVVDELLDLLDERHVLVRRLSAGNLDRLEDALAGRELR